MQRGNDGRFAVISAEDRFWQRTEKGEGCWLWKAKIDRDGYGYLSVNGRRKLAHRFSYELHNGTALQRGEVVRHTCDTPACVNPAHLLAGTQLDNVADRQQRGRVARGERNGRAKLDAEKVNSIRAAQALGATDDDLATFYGVSAAVIYDIRRGKTWRDAPKPTATARVKQKTQEEKNRDWLKLFGAD